MFDKLNKLVFTLIALALALILGWWTLFLRGKLVDHASELEGAKTQIELLEGDLAVSAEQADRLGEDLVAAQTEIGEKNVAIGQLETALDAAAIKQAATEAELAASEAEVQTLAAAVRLLKVSHRVARLEILSREQTPGGPITHLRFVELGPDGNPLDEARELSVEGTRVYVEALVIKFDDDFVEAGDFLRGSSICLFQRVFGERQSPDQGPSIERRSGVPTVYAADHNPDPFYDQLWDHFWTYAGDPKAAQIKGVRALHGEAPFIEAKPGRSYRVVLRASGGLSITPE